MDIENTTPRELIYVGEPSDAQVNYGGHTDPRELLEYGTKYKMTGIEVHSWHTRVFLDGFDNMYFNSVWFDEVEQESQDAENRDSKK